MKKIVLSLLIGCSVYTGTAQVPNLVKPLLGTSTEPNSKDQEGWKNNEWNGLFFYQGKGTPTKLCVTNGTSAGTQLLADVGAGAIVATLPARDFMYIITNRYASFSPLLLEAQIWRSDGTASGTSLVFTMPQTSISNANAWTSDVGAKRNLSITGNLMFFTGYDPANGTELWMTDGTAAGTHIVKDIKPGTGNSAPLAFCKIGTEVFFSCHQNGLERKLWKTDGTEAGTVQVPVAEPFFISDNAVGIANNKMIFFAHNTVDGYEPYVSDGTAAGTFMLKDIRSGGNSSPSQTQNLHLSFNSRHCFFVAFNGTANALWRTDGTGSGTIQLTPDAQAVSSGVSGGSYTDIDESGMWMLDYNGGGSSERLFRSDGSIAGTYLVAQNLSYAQNIKIYRNALWMAARNTGAIFNVEPWRSGGNAASTNKAYDIANSTASSDPYGYFVKNGKLYFFAATSSPAGLNLYEHTGDFTFNGSQAGGRWRDSANWNSGMPPGITDSVFVNSGTANSLQVNGANAYAGTLLMGSNATINFSNSTDSLFINDRLVAAGNNAISGTGVLVANNVCRDTVTLSGQISVDNFAVGSAVEMSNGNLFVNTQLQLGDNAALVLNDHTITLTGTTSAITQSSSTGYIHTNGTGRLVIESIGAGGRTGPVLFPIGNREQYNPVTISNSGAADHFGSRVQTGVATGYSGETGNGIPYSNSAVNAAWFITEATPGSSNASIGLQWNASQELPLFNRALSRFGHYTSGTWQLGPTGAATGSDPYIFNGTGISSFSPFGIFNDNVVLPLHFISFKASACNDRQVCLQWRTANEQLVSHFDIERSTDGLHFIKLGQVAAKNLSDNYYTSTDDLSAAQLNRQLYYRVRQADLNGKFTYSAVGTVLVNGGVSIGLYPNPVAELLNISNAGLVKTIQLISLEGKMLKEWSSPLAALSLTEFPAGMYLVKMLLKNGTITEQQILKQ